MSSKLHKKEKCTGRLVAFVATMCIFFFLCLGLEQAIGTYLTTFSVKSNLHATRHTTVRGFT